MRKKIPTVIFGLILLLALIMGGAAATPFATEADAYLQGLTDDEQFSGTVLVATNGNVIFAKGYGLANREYTITNATNTLFRLGSVTKQFTAMGVLILQEDGKLHVTNRVAQFVEDCPEAWQSVTIHHLLTHTSGIPSFTGFGDNLQFERLPTTVADTVRRFKDKPLEFEPGAKMRYSNSGYVLLGYIMEKVAGKSYEAFLTERIFRPLGMSHSGYDHPETILPKRAAGYAKRAAQIVNCIPFAMDTPHAAGALYSTVGDLLAWDQALYSERLVPAKALEAMFTEFKGHYCYGWFRDDLAERTAFSHGGGISGFRTHVIRFPKERVYLVVLSNFEVANASRIADKLARMYFHAEP